jgi:GT2 family glycosyltransferase
MSPIAGISIVIPNFNGEVLLPQVLPTVFIAADNTGLPYEIIVVDDCSTDGTLTMLANNFPRVKVMKNENNRGFSYTSNKGISAAAYDWVLLLNSDVKLEPGYFIPLLKYGQYKKIFGVMGRITGWDNDAIQDGAKYPFFHGVKIKTSGNYLLADEQAMTAGLYTMYLSGANAFMNKRAFIAIGGFNEMFSPFYVEDFELSLRAWRLGYECYYDHFAVCRHRTSTTIVSGNRKDFVKKIYNRNKMYLHAIHLEGAKRFLWFTQLFAETFVQAIMFKKYYLQAITLFFSGYRHVVNSRRDIEQKSQGEQPIPVTRVVERILLSTKGKKVHKF